MATLAQRATLARRKLTFLASEIKGVVEVCRQVATDPTTADSFLGCFHGLDALYTKFHAEWDELTEIYLLNNQEAEFPSANDTTLRQSTKRYYQECCRTYVQLTKPAAGTALDTSLNTAIINSSQSSRARLPKINLPKFTGDLTEWPNFQDIYTSLVHNDTYLSPIEKFHFLIASLDGPALSVVKTIPLAGDNYNQAWKALQTRYTNHRRLASTHLHKLLDAKPLPGKPSPSVLQSYMSAMAESVAAFQNLKVPHAEEFILFEIAVRGLDTETREAFEIAEVKTDFPRFNTLVEFVQQRCVALSMAHRESTNHPKSTHDRQLPPSPNKLQPKVKPHQSQASLLVHHRTTPARESTPETKAEKPGALSCFICSRPHILSQCQVYKAKSPTERFQLLKNWPGCKNCLHPSHPTKRCTSKWTCRTCKGHHHTTLHFPKPLPANSNMGDHPTTPSNQPSTQPSTSTVLASTSCLNTDVLLGTALAQLKDLHGNYHTIRLVIDSGSQCSFITTACVHKFDLQQAPTTFSITGIGQTPFDKIEGRVLCSVTPLKAYGPKINVEALVVPAITASLPQTHVPVGVRQKYTEFQLADPTFWDPGPIDLLLGADLFASVISGLPVLVHPNHPHVIGTIFGDVIIGRFQCQDTSNSKSVFTCTHDDTLNNIMKQFWSYEEVHRPATLSAEDHRCEEQFKQTHSRLPTGRYVVSLPWKSEYKPSTSVRHQAFRRFYNLEAKLGKDSELKAHYTAFMKEFLDLGHMVSAKDTSDSLIPHHAVVKRDRDHMKIRVVFDGSAKSSCGSLNDHLSTGPKLQLELSTILLNFRRYRVAFTADIIKMYRQILVAETDRSSQHIVWRPNPADNLEEFELKTLTYGLSCSPYLALRVIRQLTEDEGDPYPLATETLLTEIYVDDILTGADSCLEAMEKRDQLIELLQKGQFQLSKWACNRSELIPSDSKHQYPKPLTTSEDNIKVLGLQWDPVEDEFSYQVETPCLPKTTKRGILSTIARLFDPLGYLAPVTFYAKRILQDLWQAGTTWDEPVPENLCQAWDALMSEFPHLSSIKIPRWIPQDSSSQNQIIGLCDASQRGYCAVIYLRSTRTSSCDVILLKAKTKLAHIKPVSIPRLELLAALLLVRLYTSIDTIISHFNVRNTIFFTDSSIVLGWLRTPPQLMKTFVAHRIVEILETAPSPWWIHVHTTENSADCGSRGLLPSQLKEHSLWWHGPTWLQQSPESWPTTSVDLKRLSLPEMKENSISLINARQTNDLLLWSERFSSYLKLIRTLAWVRRFANNCRCGKTKTTSGPLTAGELRATKLACISIYQNHFYPECFSDQGINPKTCQNLNSLNIFKDASGILRVGGRLRHSDLGLNQKHPILLPKRSHLTTLIVDYFHQAYLHAGPATLQSLIHQQYWIPSARSLIKQRKLKCLRCFKLSRHNSSTYMGDLPPERLTTIRALLHTGVDFAGPLLCRESARRKASVSKAYICLFVCMSTKAIHLECVPQLSTEAFLDALERFTSRRGVPAKMHSDCGTNFIGASNYIKEVALWYKADDVEEDIVKALSAKGIEWAFNPPYAPHFGGLWEAGVKVVKTLLVKTLGNQPYLEKELTTILTKIEAILNSRPLSPMSSDPSDLQPLTPGHFLIGQPLTMIPEPSFLDVADNRLSRWQLMRKQVQQFWNRWRNEYVHTLQQRKKWTHIAPNIAIGELVLLKERSADPLQ